MVLLRTQLVDVVVVLIVLRGVTVLLLFVLQGVTVEGVCSSLRQLPLLRPLARVHTLVLLCGTRQGHADSIEVTLVSTVNARA